ncbi:MAG: OB-fold domain-containing protein, partial [Actinomycetota bacterium]|nr:OB-fold domain-containing protein [Actinomycetota bacterium]
MNKPLPLVTDETAHFWHGGRDGTLQFLRCESCEALVHPPSPVCRHCRGRGFAVAAVSGRGTVVGVTVNHQMWDPRFEPPFTVALVAIDEDPRIRVHTNLVDVDLDQVRPGMRVEA